MSQARYYGAGLPYAQMGELPGKLIVLEGNDGVGRSTQIELLRQWLETEGYGAADTGLARSPLTQPGIDAAMSGHTLGRLTMSLFYATDFADRLENQVIPALKAGLHVLSDRYFYSIVARDVARGADPEWAEKVYGFALVPDIALYLRAEIDTLAARMVHGRGFNYWECGMDLGMADNYYDSFIEYQSRLRDQFDAMAAKFGFVTIDADRSALEVFEELKVHILALEGR